MAPVVLLHYHHYQSIGLCALRRADRFFVRASCGLSAQLQRFRDDFGGAEGAVVGFAVEDGQFGGDAAPHQPLPIVLRQCRAGIVVLAADDQRDAGVLRDAVDPAGRGLAGPGFAAVAAPGGDVARAGNQKRGIGQSRRAAEQNAGDRRAAGVPDDDRAAGVDRCFQCGDPLADRIDVAVRVAIPPAAIAAAGPVALRIGIARPQHRHGDGIGVGLTDQILRDLEDGSDGTAVGLIAVQKHVKHGGFGAVDVLVRLSGEAFVAARDAGPVIRIGAGGGGSRVGRRDQRAEGGRNQRNEPKHDDVSKGGMRGKVFGPKNPSVK